MKVTVPVPMPPPQPDAATTAPKKRNKVKAPRPETVEPAPAAKDDSAKSDSAKDRAAKEPKPRLGVELAPVPAEVADYLELDGDAFQVVRVMDDMPAARKGLKPRDILLEVNGTPIHAFDDVVKALDGVDPDTVKVVVLRKGQRKEL
jgi:C-terminal processing protease CtpA/Prc